MGLVTKKKMGRSISRISCPLSKMIREICGWATYDDGVWRNDGKNLLHYPLKDGNKDVYFFLYTKITTVLCGFVAQYRTI